MDLTIDELGAAGDGIAHLKGEKLYLPLTVPGDRVRLTLTPRPQVAELLSPGPERVAPPCPHYGVCGGCGLQHLADGAYQRWKRALVVQALARAGLEGEALVGPLVRTPPGDRRRADLTVQRTQGRVWVGFNQRASHQLVEPDHCLVLAPALVRLLPLMRQYLGPALPERGRLDAIATVLDGGVDLLLSGQLAGELGGGLAARQALADLAQAADLARLSWRRGPRQPSEPVAWRRLVALRFGTTPVSPAPGAFLQASPTAERAMIAEVLAALAPAAGPGWGAGLELERGLPVADLFAGCGTFALPLAEARAAVHAVDADQPGLSALAAASRAPGACLSLTSERRDLFRAPLSAAELARFQAVVFDPPRAGAAAQVAQLAASAVPRLVAVSCNPATFGRDLRVLLDGGYRLERVVGFDQFLWTAHVELVAWLRRK